MAGEAAQGVGGGHSRDSTRGPLASGAGDGELGPRPRWGPISEASFAVVALHPKQPTGSRFRTRLEEFPMNLQGSDLLPAAFRRPSGARGHEALGVGAGAYPTSLLLGEERLLSWLGLQAKEQGWAGAGWGDAGPARHPATPEATPPNPLPMLP